MCNNLFCVYWIGINNLKFKKIANGYYKKIRNFLKKNRDDYIYLSIK